MCLAIFPYPKILLKHDHALPRAYFNSTQTAATLVGLSLRSEYTIDNDPPS